VDSIELVKKAIEFDGPERIPLDFLPPRYTDFCTVMNASVTQTKPKGKTGIYTDIWGCTWKTVDKSMGRPFESPMKKWEDLKNFKFPDLLKEEDYEVAREIIAENSHRYIIGGDPLIGLWERAKALVGTSNFLTGLHLFPQYVCELLDKLLDLQLQVIEKWSKLGVHGFMTWDDWGTENALWISPHFWRKVFKPRYKKVADTIHSYNMHYFFHSCGFILDIIPDLIEIGVDVLQIDQPELMGIEKLGNEFGGKVCFFCPVDIQRTMQIGSLREIEESAKKMIKYLGDYNGGFMAREYPQPEAINITQEKIEVMYQSFWKYGKYPLSF